MLHTPPPPKHPTHPPTTPTRPAPSHTPNHTPQAACYIIAGASYTLDDLENGILRGNQAGAASLGMLLKLPWLSKRTFAASDPRARHVSERCSKGHFSGGGMLEKGREGLGCACVPLIAGPQQRNTRCMLGAP